MSCLLQKWHLSENKRLYSEQPRLDCSQHPIDTYIYIYIYIHINIYIYIYIYISLSLSLYIYIYIYYPIAYCLLPIAYCLLPIAYCLLPIAYSFDFEAYPAEDRFKSCFCRHPELSDLVPHPAQKKKSQNIAYCLLPIAYCQLPIAYCV